MCLNSIIFIGSNKIIFQLIFFDVIWFFSSMKGPSLFTKIIPMEEEGTNILLMEFSCVMDHNHVWSVVTLWAINNSSSFYVADNSCDCFHIISSFSSALIFMKDLDISTFDSFRAFARFFFSFFIYFSLLNNFLFNFLTFTTFHTNHHKLPAILVHDHQQHK